MVGVGSGSPLSCPCGAGLCTMEPFLLSPRFLFVCCPRGQPDVGGCGFMCIEPAAAAAAAAQTGAGFGTGTGTGTTEAPPQVMCPCGAGACSIGTARNGRNFYACSACTYRKWCDSGASSQCYICKEEGHWYMDCPRLPPSATNKKICFYCKQEDHYAAHCRFKQRRNQRRN